MISGGQKRCSCCMHLLEQGDVCSACGYDNQNSQTPPYCLPEGTCLKQRYYTGCVLGEGGFGITYLGWDQTLSIPVAIKEYYPREFVRRNPVRSHSQVNRVDGETCAQQEYQKGMKAFLKEAQTLAQFQSLEGAAVVHDYFTENDTAYIVMEYIDGISVEEYVQKNGQIPAGQIQTMLRPVLDTLEEMHAHHIIHRDVSADNLMITRQGFMKLVDFGAARSTVNRDHTMTVIYKRGFAPEEQYRSKGQTGPWSDVYSVSAVMYYMLSGVMPEEASQRLVSDRTVPLDQMEGVALPKGWSDAIGKGMSVMAADRYQSIRALREALGESGRTACREHWGQERQEERRRKSLAAGEEELSTERIAGELLQAGKEQESRKERQLIREKALRAKRKIYLRIGLVLIVLVAAGAGIAMMRLNGQAQKEGRLPAQTSLAADMPSEQKTQGGTASPEQTTLGITATALPEQMTSIPKTTAEKTSSVTRSPDDKKPSERPDKTTDKASKREEKTTKVSRNRKKKTSATARPNKTEATPKTTKKKTTGQKDKKNVIGSLDTLLGE